MLFSTESLLQKDLTLSYRPLGTQNVHKSTTHILLYFADVLHLIKSGKCDADAGLYYIQLQVYSLGLRPISSINVAFVFNDF